MQNTFSILELRSNAIRPNELALSKGGWLAWNGLAVFRSAYVVLVRYLSTAVSYSNATYSFEDCIRFWVRTVCPITVTPLREGAFHVYPMIQGFG